MPDKQAAPETTTGAIHVGFGARYLRVGVAAIGLTFVLAIALGASGALTPKAQRTAAGASTTLTIISGAVSTRSAGRDFTLAADGATLSIGDSVRTGLDGRAVLTYFEGTTVEIEPSSELTIDAASAGPDGSTVLLMTQNIGRTWHVVTHLLSGNSKYEVRTPASTASVRGTQFEVAVAEDVTTVTTSEGAVATSDAANAAEVLVTPGLTTTTRVGERPAPPAPAPAPERRVTVTVGDPNTLIVDPLGRANGFKDGKLVIQTPGASVRIVDGKLVITLLNMPDGTLAAHPGKKDAADSDIETTVEDQGHAPVTVTGKTGTSGGSKTGVDVRRGTGTAPSVTPKSGELPAPKIGEVPAQPSDETEKKDPEKKEPEKNDPEKKEPETPRPIEPGRVPTIRTPEPARTAETPKSGDDRPPQPAASGFRPNIQLPAAPGPVAPTERPAPPHSPPPEKTTAPEKQPEKPAPAAATTRGRP